MKICIAKKIIERAGIRIPCLLCTLLFFVTGCFHTSELTMVHPVKDNQRQIFPMQTLISGLCRSYNRRLPQQFRLKQQIILTVFNKQYDFIGYFIKGTGERYRALGFTEMGMKIFDILYSDKQLNILLNNYKIPENPLKDGLSRDILQLFFNNLQDETVQGYYTAEGTILLKEENRDYLFKADTAELLYSTYSLKEKPGSRITYGDYRKVNNMDVPLPYYIRVENRRWHYSLDISLLSIEELVQTDQMFNVIKN